MQLEITETNASASALPRATFMNIRWGAIFAGLAVGLASNMVLMLLGTAAGLSFFEIGGSEGSTNTESVFPVAASVWNTVSMVSSAFIGGYIAARGSGLKRTSDGILQAVVAWGMTLILAVFMASSVTGATFNAMFPSLQEGVVQESASVIGDLEEGDRQSASASLQRNLGISSNQAQQVIDQALALSGREETVGESGRVAARETLRTAAIVSIWLTLSTLLSLAAALGGGVFGAHGTRRILHRRTATLV